MLQTSVFFMLKNSGAWLLFYFLFLISMSVYSGHPSIPHFLFDPKKEAEKESAADAFCIFYIIILP